MTVPILICECGMRLKVRWGGSREGGSLPELRSYASGSRPGCPGASPSPGETARASRRRWAMASSRTRSRSDEQSQAAHRSPEDSPARPTYVKAQPSTPMADGFLPVLDRPETTWFSSLLYPLRGAETLGVIAMHERDLVALRRSRSRVLSHAD